MILTLTVETVHSLEQYLSVCSSDELGVHEPILCRVITRADVDDVLSVDFDAYNEPLTGQEWREVCREFEGREGNNTVECMAFWVADKRGNSNENQRD